MVHAQRPVVLMHGYSDDAEGLDRWAERLGREVVDVKLTQYVSLSDEVTIADLAEAFDDALRAEPELRAGEEFDAIVHSTGMLVIRAWLTAYGGLSERSSRLKHLIGLAPATFGSPLAHRGRSWLGALVKGNKEWGPDFLEAGDLVLRDLELAGAFTWDLAERDLCGERTVYGDGPDTPYPFVFVGTEAYDGWRRLVNGRGTDGTVRHAGVGFDVRRLRLDLTARRLRDDWADRAEVTPWRNTTVPLVFVAGANHATILRAPSDDQVAAMRAALSVGDAADYRAWREHFADVPQPHPYQQFILRVLDERGDPVPDWWAQLGCVDADHRFHEVEEGALEVHANTADPSRRCLHVDVERVRDLPQGGLWLRLTASSGSDLVAYDGIRPGRNTEWGGWPREEDGERPVYIDLGAALADADLDLLRPFSTVLVDVVLDRVPAERVLVFLPGQRRPSASSRVAVSQ